VLDTSHGQPQKFPSHFLRLLPRPLRRKAKKKKGNFGLRRRFHSTIVFYHTIESNYTIRYTLVINMANASKKLAANMKKIRAQKGMSQGDICRALGVDRAYISTIESGKQNPTLATVEKIALALGVSVDELLK